LRGKDVLALVLAVLSALAIAVLAVQIMLHPAL